jgi:galactose mutarotase-like enzyme
MSTCEHVSVQGIDVVRLGNERLSVDVAPAVGGRIISLKSNATGYEFLWRNARLPLVQLPAGSEYDPNFYGGVDELLPNDPPETIGGVAMPDHGELWTLPLSAKTDDGELFLRGELPLTGFSYERRISLLPGEAGLALQYRITNTTAQGKPFLWKLHAALNIAPGDRIDCPAQSAVVLDPAWSRWKTRSAFAWPRVDGDRADIIPPKDGTTDFLCLSGLTRGEMSWQSASKRRSFTYRFDPKVFPYAWYFASYGGFFDHYTAVLEPCTCRDTSVNEAYAAGACTFLKPGESLQTTVTIAIEDEP